MENVKILKSRVQNKMLNLYGYIYSFDFVFLCVKLPILKYSKPFCFTNLMLDFLGCAYFYANFIILLNKDDQIISTESEYK